MTHVKCKCPPEQFFLENVHIGFVLCTLSKKYALPKKTTENPFTTIFKIGSTKVLYIMSKHRPWFPF